MTEIIKTEAGIPYYDEQMSQTKQEITDLIRLFCQLYLFFHIRGAQI